MSETSHDSETAAVGEQVITACAFIHENIDGVEKVFLPKRAVTKKLFPGVFELPGGHIDFGEDPVDGLKREIREEFQSAIEVGDPFFSFTYTNEIKGSHSVEVVYFARFISDIVDIALNAEDHSEYGWFEETEISNAYTPDKGAENIEFIAIKKGFALLRGESLVF